MSHVREPLTLNASEGVLVECDPSIKAIIEKINSEKHDFLIENLGDELVVIKEAKMEELKTRLDQVFCVTRLQCLQRNCLPMPDAQRLSDNRRR